MDRCSSCSRRLLLVFGFGIASAMGFASVQAQELCGGVDYPFPYTDVSGVGAAFCPGIMEAYVTGVSKGTTPTTFSPNETVTRVQMTTFLQRSLDQGLVRTNRRAALSQFWTTRVLGAMQAIDVANTPLVCAADGENIWVATIPNTVVEVQASTGKVLGTWTGAAGVQGMVIAPGKVFAVADSSPGSLYVIDPTQSPGPVTIAASSLGDQAFGIAFDGTNLWTANLGPTGSVSIISPQSPYTVVNTVTTGFNAPYGILYDGANIWVTDAGAGTLLKLDGAGNILQTVAVGIAPTSPVFDGANIWVPNLESDSVTVVQASNGNVIATISTDSINHLSGPVGATFDGERVLVANATNSSVTVFKAADLSVIVNVGTGAGGTPSGPCSDGINLWVNTDDLLRL
jgi:YVTN family beta-propeller protein